MAISTKLISLSFLTQRSLLVLVSLVFFSKLVAATPAVKAQEIAQQPSATQDATPAAAQRAFDEAYKLYQQATAESARQAIVKFEEALVLWRQVGDKKQEATTLNYIGFIYDALGEKQKALEFLNIALPIHREVKNRVGEATTLSVIGLIYNAIGQPQKALEFLNIALPIHREVKNRVGEATTLSVIGLIYNAIGQPQKALEFLNIALPIHREVKNRPWEATTLEQIGNAYNAIGQPQKALEFLNIALPIHREVKNRVGEATTLSVIGLIYNAIGQKKEALEYYQQALPIFRLEGNRAWEISTLHSIANIYKNNKQPQKTLEFYKELLSIYKQMHNRLEESKILSYIGDVYKTIGQRQTAIDTYNLALKIFHAEKNRSWEATTLNDIGIVYSENLEGQKALEYFNQALAIRKELNDRSGEAATRNNICTIYLGNGQLQEGLDCVNESLKISQGVNERAEEAKALTLMGFIYLNIGQSQKALYSFKQTLPIFQEVKDLSGQTAALIFIGFLEEEAQKSLQYLNQALPLVRHLNNGNHEASLLCFIGMAYISNKELQKGLEYLNQALSIYQKNGSKYQLIEALIVQGLGYYYQQNNEPQKALEYLNKTLQIYHKQNIMSSKELIIAAIGLLYNKMNQPTQAISRLEESAELTLKLRGTLRRDNKEKIRQQFIESRGYITTPLVKLLIDQKQYDKAYEWVNRATTADLADYTRLLHAQVKNPKAQKAIDEWNKKREALDNLRQNLYLPNKFSEALSRQMRELEAEVIKSAEKISNSFPEIAELFETKPEDIAKLRAIIPEETVVIQPVLLKDATNIPDTIALFVLTRDKLTVKQIPVDPAKFDVLITQTYEKLTNRHDSEYLDNLEQLYKLIIRPVEAEIQASKPKQLSFIATGKLRYIPFEALYDGKTDQYLIQKYPISYLTRLSTHSLQAKTTPNPANARKVLAFGNPIPKPPLALEAAEAEVKSIMTIFPRSEAFIHSEATLNTFKIQSPRFAYIHLATHGCFVPEGCCLPKSKDCRKPDKIDLKPNTILFADKEFNIADVALLGLENTELITLSACQTGLQTESNGEEISGLAYLFERAGSKAVIASLWSAADKKTQEIMVQFYQNIHKGMSKDEALRHAKLSQIKSHPFFWSPFVLIGDAR